MTSSSARQRETVAAQYEGWARIYDVFWRRYMRQTLPVLQEAAAVQSGECVLDLACGTGELLRRIHETTPDVALTGIDIAQSMVETARRKMPSASGVQLEQADAHDLPFADASFDVVLCASTFHYFSEPSAVLAETRRVLRPGGRFVVLDWCRDFWACRVMDVVLQQFDPAHDTCYTLAQLRHLMGDAGFQVRYDFRYRFDWVWGMMVLEGVPD